MTEKTISRTVEVETAPEQAWFWTPEWQAGEREADAQLAAGKSENYQSGADFMAALAVEHEGLSQQGR